MKSNADSPQNHSTGRDFPHKSLTNRVNQSLVSPEKLKTMMKLTKVSEKDHQKEQEVPENHRFGCTKDQKHTGSPSSTVSEESIDY